MTIILNDTETRCATCGATYAYCKCAKCERPLCYRCMDVSGDARLCPGHIVRCTECGRETSARHAAVCVKCGELLCEYCAYHWDSAAYCPDERPECVQCGIVNDGDGRFCYDCEDPVCSQCMYLCEDCGEAMCEGCTHYCDECNHDYCENCWREHGHNIEPKAPDYRDPYDGKPYQSRTFTFGLEIELDGSHDHDVMEDSPSLIAGWCADGSLHGEGGLEYQSQPLTMRDVWRIADLVERQDPDGDMSLAGGHMHVRRTPRQTPSRWYWALSALTREQAESLNMRHMTEDRWCELRHDRYSGKATAVNDDHSNTIELRTFGPWYTDTAELLTPAVQWVHTMWRFFQHHPVYKIKTRDIQAMSRTACAAAQPERKTRVQLWKENH